ncbi:MAG TPA: hypothetical protein VJA16_01420 [Thermoanaerobaculia bacterium]
MSPRTVTGEPTLLKPFVRYVRSFGVTAAIGMAPFLGKVKVPGFTALLEVVPFQLRDVLIPLSAFLMGLIAVALEFYAGEEIAPGRVRSLFGGGLAALVLGLVLFTALSSSFVERQQFGSQNVGVLVTDARLPAPGCACPPEINDKACIKRLSLKEEALDSCWGGPAFQRRKLSLQLTYLFLTGGFASLIALLLIQQQGRRRRESADAKPAPARPGRGTKERVGKGRGASRPGARRGARGARGTGGAGGKRAPAVDDPRDRR